MIAKLGFLLLFAAALAAQPAPNRAGLVIQYADGSVETSCVRFSEPEIDGLELLERAAVPVITQGSALGAAVCKIGPDGCDFPTEQCFCATDGLRAVYWALHIRADNTWAYANLGAANQPVTDGTVHGWAWGTGDASAGAQPPLLDIDAICGPPALAPTAPSAAATAVPPTVVSATAAPAITALPTATPEAAAPPATGSPMGLVLAVLLIGLLSIGVMVVRRRR